MSHRAVDAVVLGAGIVGVACARALAHEGMSVAVVEKAIVGGGATAASMGHLVVMDDSEAQFALTRYSQNLWNELAPELPPEAEFESCGTIWVASDEEEMAAVCDKRRFYAGRGVTAELLDSHSLADGEPNLRAGLAGGLLVPGDSVIYPPSATTWLLEDARRQGAELLAAAAAEQCLQEGVRLSDGGFIPAGVTVHATGTWAPRLIPDLQVRPRKGHLAITDRYPDFIRHQILEMGYLKSAQGTESESVAFNVQPRSTGQLLVGSSRQFGQEESSIDSPILERMLQRAIEFMPALAGLSVIRTWAGFRAATPDKLPLIGPCPGRPGTYLATGHEGLGITTSLGTAQLLADLILERPPAIAPEPYLPSRFPLQQAHA